MKSIYRLSLLLVLLHLLLNSVIVAAPTTTPSTIAYSIVPTPDSLRDSVQLLRDSLAALQKQIHQQDTPHSTFKLNLAPQEKTTSSEITEEQTHHSIYLINAAADIQHSKVGGSNEKLAARFFMIRHLSTDLARRTAT